MTDTTLGTDTMLGIKEGGIGRLIFNNPQKRNAVSLDMWEAAVRILGDFEVDPAVRVVVVSGAGGKAFVSGADISKFDSERAEVEEVRRYGLVTEAAYSGLHAFPKPTIAAIRGYCIGGGLGLAACCDIRICTEGSRFALPAARLGLGYGAAPIRRLMDVVGPAFAKEIFFTARQFTAAEAVAMGLVNRAVPDGELDALVAEYTALIAANAPLTMAATKFAMGEVLKDETARDLAEVKRRVDACFASADYREGRRAFMEKRSPRFTGT